MRKNIIVCWLILGLYLIPTSLMAEEWFYKRSANVSIAKNTTEPFTYLLIDKQIHVSKKETYVHILKKVNNTAGVQASSELSAIFEPNYQSIKIISASILRGTNTLKQNPNKIKYTQQSTNVEEKQYYELKTALVYFEDVRPNDILEFEYIISGTNPIFNKFSDIEQIVFDATVENFYCSYVYPTSTKLSFSSSNIPKEGESLKSNNLGENIKTWHIINLNPIVNQEVYTNLHYYYNSIPRIEASEYKNWVEVEAWGKQVFDFNEYASPMVKKVIDTLINKNENIGTQVLKICRFVQNDIRYLGIETGINSHKPHKPDEVIKQRYGDCKDKAQLLSCMLNEINIKAYPNLINTVNGESIGQYLPSPLVFNHVTSFVEMPFKPFFLDPTIPFQGGTVNTGIAYPKYRNTLIIGNKSSNIYKIENYEPIKQIVFQTYNIADTAFNTTVSISSCYYGERADQMRAILYSNDKEVIKNEFIQSYTNIYPSAKFINDNEILDNLDNNTLLLKEFIDLGDIWQNEENDKKAFFNFSQFADKIIIPKSKASLIPIELYNNFEIDFTATLNLPSTWNIKEEEGSQNNKFFDFKYIISHPSAKQVLIHYYLSYKKDRVEANEMAEYYDCIKKLEENIGYSFTFNKKTESYSATNITYIINNILAVLLILAFAFYLFKIHYFKDKNLEETDIAFPIESWVILIGISVAGKTLFQLFISFKYSFLYNVDFGAILLSSDSFVLNVLGFLALMVIKLIMPFLFLGLMYSFILFINRRTYFPVFYSFILISILLTNILIFTTVKQFNLSDDINTMRDIIYPLIQTLVTLPILYYSNRIRNTFVFLHPSKYN